MSFQEVVGSFSERLDGWVFIAQIEGEKSDGGFWSRNG